MGMGGGGGGGGGSMNNTIDCRWTADNKVAFSFLIARLQNFLLSAFFSSVHETFEKILYCSVLFLFVCNTQLFYFCA